VAQEIASSQGNLSRQKRHWPALITSDIHAYDGVHCNWDMVVPMADIPKL
jgi:hypothetical protein